MWGNRRQPSIIYVVFPLRHFLKGSGQPYSDLKIQGAKEPMFGLTAVFLDSDNSSSIEKGACDQVMAESKPMEPPGRSLVGGS